MSDETVQELKEKWDKEFSYDACLSYRHQDRKLADKLAHALKDAKYKVWFDQWSLRPGEPWQQAVEGALAESKTVLIIIGSEGIGPWAQVELSYGLSRQLKDPRFRIIPILGPGANPQKLPSIFKTLTYIDLRDWSQDNFRLLLGTLNALQKGTEVHVATPRVFLSHAKEDERRIAELYFMLKDEGFDPWFDRENLLVGDRWRREIATAIQESDFFALCLSALAIEKRGFIQKEIRTAVSEYQRRPQDACYLLPLRLEDCVIPDIQLDENTSLPDLQWIDIFEGDNAAVQRLAKSIWGQWRRLRIEAPAKVPRPTPLLKRTPHGTA